MKMNLDKNVSARTNAQNCLNYADNFVENGYNPLWMLWYYLACAVVYALLSIAEAVRDLREHL